MYASIAIDHLDKTGALHAECGILVMDSIAMIVAFAAKAAERTGGIVQFAILASR